VALWFPSMLGHAAVTMSTMRTSSVRVT